MTDVEELLADDPDVPSFLGRLMGQRHWDQKALARAVGRHQATVSKWFTRNSRIYPESMKRLAAVSGVTVSQIGAIVARTEITTKPTRSELERVLAEREAENEALRRQMKTSQRRPKPGGGPR